MARQAQTRQAKLAHARACAQAGPRSRGVTFVPVRVLRLLLRDMPDALGRKIMGSILCIGYRAAGVSMDIIGRAQSMARSQRSEAGSQAAQA